MRISDWSSDVCSSDLKARREPGRPFGTGADFQFLTGDTSPMVKAEWGTKRTCPKCGTRFYDLGKEEPVTCIECGVSWEPEPVLNSKRPMTFEEQMKKVVAPEQTVSDPPDEEDLEHDEAAEENQD